MNSQKILPHLWFDSEAKEAAEFYVEAFGGGSKMIRSSKIHNTPAPNGDTDILMFELLGQEFLAINAGPYFKVNPSISFFVNFDPSRDPEAKENLQKLWDKLADGGQALMELAEYPFSKWYGWIQDKFGVSWQLILTNPEGESRPIIVPSFLFTGDVNGKAEEAIDFYVSVFKNSKKGNMSPYPDGSAPSPETKLSYGDFMLENQWFAAMDGGPAHEFGFNEGVSILVNCQDQQEIDYYWEKLSAVPESEQCGWLKDKYGISWQFQPDSMQKMLTEGTPEQVARVTEAFLQMKKFNIAELEKAYAGE